MSNYVRTLTRVFALCALAYIVIPISNRNSPEPAGISLAARDNLLRSLPREVQDRIRALMKRGFNQCVKMPDEYTEVIQRVSDQNERDELLSGLQLVEQILEGPGQINCFATIHWVLSGSGLGIIEEYNLTDYLAANGYRSREIRLIGKQSSGKYEHAPLSIDKYKLAPGDILLFAGTNNGRYIHAVLYLGKSSDVHYVFHKPNRLCGPYSPFEITDLNGQLERFVGKRIKEIDDTVGVMVVFSRGKS